MTATGADPWDIVDRLRTWARDTSWCEWLELGGSLAAGRGDRYSDVDAGIGVTDDIDVAEACAVLLGAVSGFATVADTLRQNLGTASAPTDHLIVQYRDGRQLSLVVLPAAQRQGAPPGSRVLLDRNGRLSTPWSPRQLRASREDQREWAFLAWLYLGDAVKHGRRGTVWRAVHALDETRTHLWQLYAASRELDYPAFGPVTVETAHHPPPPGIERTYPAEFTPAGIRTAALALVTALGPLTENSSVSGVREVTERNLAAWM